VSHSQSFEKLVGIMDRLRGPNGCPWDREQDYSTLRGYLLEECYEVAEELDQPGAPGLCEELGDLLFQIVFLSRIAREDGRFSIDDVIEGISEKMIRRHPHVFGQATADTADEVLENWEAIKREEKAAKGAGPPGSLLDGIPRALPELLKAQRLGTKAARVGFDWQRPAQVLEKVEEELAELRVAMESGDAESTREELGDALFSLAMLARQLGLEAEAALAGSNRKFQQRFRWIEERLARDGENISATATPRFEELWEQAKRELGPAARP
jgi:tetrapyrrole methylase family protein/MazG family protein